MLGTRQLGLVGLLWAVCVSRVELNLKVINYTLILTYLKVTTLQNWPN